MARRTTIKKKIYKKRTPTRTKLKFCNRKPSPKSLKYTFSSSNVIKFKLPIKPNETFKNKFLNYDEIKEYLKRMEKEFPNKFHLEVVGDSNEGRPIYLAVISNGSRYNNKIVTLVEAGSNAYDWLAISSALYLIDFLTRDDNLVKITDYFILPCSNPDAYHRSVMGGIISTKDVSINLSNNFPLLLGTTNMQYISTDEFLKALEVWKRNVRYGSPTTEAIFRAVTGSKFTVKLFISLQEEGSKIVYPFGLCNQLIPDEDDLNKVAKSAQARLKHLKLQCGSIYQLCGLTFGTVIDFLTFNCSPTKFLYIFHIKDRRKKPNVEDILIYGEDVLNCVKSMARSVFMYYNKDQINKFQCI